MNPLLSLLKIIMVTPLKILLYFSTTQTQNKIRNQCGKILCTRVIILHSIHLNIPFSAVNRKPFHPLNINTAENLKCSEALL